jgi:tetratricopeptide (TPR) repeat protein
MKHSALAALTLIALVTNACATTQSGRANTAASALTAARVRSMQGPEFRVVGRPDGTGDAYDARLLFERAAAALQTRRFDEAIADYDRLIREFPQSNLVAASHFNRGQAYQSSNRGPEAMAAYTLAATTAHGSNNDLARDAWFRVAAVGESANRPAEIVTATDRVLTIPRVSLVDRVEALGRQAAAKLAIGDRPGAARAAQDAISLAPTVESVSALGDDTFIAQARFVLAEISRLEAADIAIRIDVDDAALSLAIERRVQHVTHAHVLYNDAIRVGNPHWAAASGYALGEMYRALYGSIVETPLPCDWEEPAIRIYRQRTGNRLRPLVQAALRAWEATIGMARRNAIADNAWVRRADEQVEALRQLVLRGPDPALMRPSPNCASPATAPSSTATPSGAAASAQTTPSNAAAARP